jgi:transglutaminase-like putative cysteine protease
LSWKGSALFVEDLSSVNGTYVDGERVKVAKTRPGAELRIGDYPLPWSHEGLRALLKAGAGQRTLVMPTHKAPTFVCGSCGHVGALPAGPTPPQITCPKCNTTLATGEKPSRAASGANVTAWAVAFVLISFAAAGYAVYSRTRPPSVASDKPGASTSILPPAVTEQLAALRVGGETAQKLAAALSPMDPLTRNTAVKLAARNQGAFHVEQVAEIWAAVRKEWRYVNDPEGREYFATASETIQNGYVGDCDDFAVALASMVIAVGGKARVVLMESPKEGHAYAEACVQGEPAKVAAALTRHYKNKFRRYITGSIPKNISYRTSAECPIWLNLDWSASVPGGPYEAEKWAVAVYEGGKTEALTPAAPIALPSTTPAANAPAP